MPKKLFKSWVITNRKLTSRDRSRPDNEVRVISLSNIDALNGRITTLQIMRETLSYLAGHCDGVEQPLGLVLDDLPPTTRPTGEHHDA